MVFGSMSYVEELWAKGRYTLNDTASGESYTG